MTLSRSSVLHYFSSRYGPIPVIGGRPTHARNSSGKVADIRGEYYDALINTPRWSWETDKATSQKERRAALLLEPGRTNRVLQSSALNTTPWGPGAMTVTNGYATVAGVTLARLTGLNGTTSVNRQAVTVVGDGTKTLSLHVRSDGVAGFGLAAFLDGTTSTVRGYLRYDIDAAGVVTSSVSGGATNLVVEAMAGGVYRLSCSIPGVIAANTNYAYAWADAQGATLTAVQLGGVQVEDGVGVTALIPTTTSVVSRSADSLSWEFPFPPQGMMIFSRHVEGGSAAMSPTLTPRVWAIEVAGGGTPRVTLGTGAGTYRAVHHNGTSQVLVDATAAPAFGDTVDLVTVLYPSGAVGLVQSINGAAATAPAASAANALAGAWSSPALWANSAGSIDIGIARLLDLRVVRYADVVASTTQGIIDEIRSFEVGPNGDVL